MLYGALILSAIMLAGVTLAARLGSKSDGFIVGVVLLANGLFCVGLVVPPVLLGGVLVLAALGIWPPRPGQRAAFHLASVGAVAGGFAGIVFSVWSDQREYARLRTVYPFEVLTDRLVPRPGGTPAAFNVTELEAHEGQYFDRERRVDRSNGRNAILRRLHEDQTELFVRNPKFGVSRMALDHPTSITLGEPEPAERWSNPPLDLMVREDVRDFSDPARWGYRRDDQVAGFLPHALRRQPGPAKGWLIERVELVGLLLAPDPRVYVSETLPRMDELRAAPTRHPDGFESPALAKLRAGEELVHDAPLGRVLGAIRSAKQCLTCHGGERGELLGAFSYRLQAR